MNLISSSKVDVLVPVSGGKDSQACLKMAIDQFGQSHVRGLFCDTMFEHPLTYKHIQDMSDFYGVRIDRVCAGDVPSKVIRYGRFPSGTARFCTDELKIRPTIEYCKEFVKSNGPFQIWYGMRLDESVDRSKRYEDRLSDELYQPHEYMRKYPKYLGKAGILVRMPVLEMTKE